MIKANYSDKSLVVDILSQSFDTNKSVNFIARQDSKRRDRIKILMEYSFETCFMFGDIYLSENKKACALILLPERKRINLKSIYWNAKLVFQCVGIDRIRAISKRETLIKNNHPQIPFYYLWFLGVYPSDQRTGLGRKLLEDIIQKSTTDKRYIYLETSTISNLSWYEKFNFKVIKELDLGYQLFVFKRSYDQRA